MKINPTRAFFAVVLIAQVIADMGAFQAKDWIWFAIGVVVTFVMFLFVSCD